MLLIKRNLVQTLTTFVVKPPLSLIDPTLQAYTFKL
jgi:hypothetical protein